MGKESNYRTDRIAELTFKDVVDRVASNHLAIGYCPLGYVTSSVRAVPLAEKKSGEAAALTPENLYSGKYPLSRGLLLYVKKAPGKPLEAPLDAFLRFVLSAEGAEAARKAGW